MSQSAATSKDSADTIRTEHESYWFTALERRASCLPHALPSTDAARDGVHSWEEEIVVLKSLVASAQARRNAFVPGCSLPPEILSRIFTFVKIHSMIPIGSQSPGIFSYNGNFNWLAITRVCRSWRNVAINHSALWADISTESKQPWNVFLQRARSFPLSIRAISPLSSGPSAMDAKHHQLINEHLHHIRDLCFTAPRSDTFTFLISNTVLKPELLALQLHLASYRIPIVLPPSFLKSAPALQEIRLTGFLFPWDAVLPNLRTLSVTTVGITPIITGYLSDDPDKALQCLQHTPKLEELSLSLFCKPESSSSNAEIVTLPNLRKIFLSGASRACLDIWCLIRPHPHADIHLSAEGPSLQETQIQEALSALSIHLASPDSPTFTKVSIFGKVGTKLLIQAVLPPDAIDTKDGDRKQVKIELDFKQSSPRGILAALYAKIPLHHIEELTVCGIESLSVDDWAPLLSAVQSVKKIVLSEMLDGPIETFCLAIAPAGILPKKRKNRSQRRALGRQAPVPHLTHLGFEHITFDVQLGADLDTETVASCVARMLKARKVAHCAPQILTISDCTITEFQIENLEQIVPGLVWDGSLGASDEDDFGDEYYDGHSGYDYDSEFDDHYGTQHFGFGLY